MSEVEIIECSPRFSERLSAAARSATPSVGIMGRSPELAPSRDQFGSMIFTHPFETRTAAQIQSPCSTRRTSLRARTHALACGCEHRGRADRVPSRSRESLPVGVPADSAGTRSRLALGAYGPKAGAPMTQSNPTHDANDPKTTAAASRFAERETSNGTGANPRPARANGTQIGISQFGFVPASQLRSNNSGREGGDQEEDR